ncbi:hypothetical protein CR513_23891, partial [Mucuna pruriens]
MCDNYRIHGGNAAPNPVITFDDRDLRCGLPSHDEPMVISMVAAKYKIELVLIDQGNSTNILYWSTYQKLRLPNVRELFTQVSIKGVIKLDTVFGESDSIKCILVLYTVVDVEASYNIIMGRPTLNRFRAVISTLHLCIKFPVGQGVGSVWADSHIAKRWDPNLSVLSSRPSTFWTYTWTLDVATSMKDPTPAEDLKEIQVGLSAVHRTKIGTTLSHEEEACLTNFLKHNSNVFAWTTDNMLDINPEFMCHRLFVSPSTKPVVQKKCKQGEEK